MKLTIILGLLLLSLSGSVWANDSFLMPDIYTTNEAACFSGYHIVYITIKLNGSDLTTCGKNSKLLGGDDQAVHYNSPSYAIEGIYSTANSFMKIDPAINKKLDKIIKLLEEQKLPECRLWFIDKDKVTALDPYFYKMLQGDDACIARRQK